MNPFIQVGIVTAGWLVIISLIWLPHAVNKLVHGYRLQWVKTERVWHDAAGIGQGTH